MLRSTWYGIRGPHNFWGAPEAQPSTVKFGPKVVTATYYRSDCEYSFTIVQAVTTACTVVQAAV